MRAKIPTYAYKNLKNDLAFEIQTLDFFRRNADPNKVGIHHRIDFYVILFIVKGTGQHIIDFETYQYKPGAIFFMAKNQVVAYRINENIEGFLLFFEEQFLYQNQVQFNDLSYSFPFNFGLYAPVIYIESNKDSFNILFHSIYQEFNAPGNSNTEEILQCLLRVVLLKVKKYFNQSEYKNNEVSRSGVAVFIKFQKLLEQHDICSRNAVDFCQNLGVSYKHLNTLCKDLTGKTLKSFIDNNFILQAKRKLTYSNLNVSEIAFSLGFEEVTNFTKYFKKHTKQSPSEFQIEKNITSG